jgi:hypothetical protein
MEACDLLIENLGKEATSNHKIEMGFLGHGAMQFEFSISWVVISCVGIKKGWLKE